MRISGSAVAGLCIGWLAVGAAFAQPAEYRAGVASGTITPTEPTWMGGYAARTQPADGKVHDLHATALVLRDSSGYTLALLSVETPNLPRAFADGIAAELRERLGLTREQVVVTCTHTHCGPLLIEPRTDIGYPLAPAQYEINRRYTEALRRKVVQITTRAVEQLAPAQIAFGTGRCGFAVNRRNNREADAAKPGFVAVGPMDPDVPVLRVRLADGRRAILFGYACHCTTLSIQQWCGDYAGFARRQIEQAEPGTTALFLAGCGGDINPLPRRKLELCESYGKQLAQAVEAVLAGPMKPVRGSFRASYRDLDLPFEGVPTRHDLEQALASGKPPQKRWAELMLKRLAAEGSLPRSCPLPLQVFQLGDDLTHVFIGGETVVDYSLRLKAESGRGVTWVSSYANHVCGYIPSERVLKEGGYEGREAMLYAGHPAAWARGLEDRIVRTIHEMIGAIRQ